MLPKFYREKHGRLCEVPDPRGDWFLYGALAMVAVYLGTRILEWIL